MQLGAARGWIRVTRSGSKNALLLEFTHTLIPVLPALLRRTRELFDLNSRPDVISRQLGRDRRLAPLIRQAPGLRVPGAFNGFEMGLRAILGQQVTVKSATTIACRLAEAFGEPIVTPFAELNRLTPAAARLARASVDEIARLGIVSARSKSIIALAQAQLSGAVALEGGVHHDPEETIARLAALPGIGQWTAHYIAMRALRWPDAFPENDVAVRNNLGGVSAKQATQMSQAWRPWRSYAVLHIWKHPARPARHGRRAPRLPGRPIRPGRTERTLSRNTARATCETTPTPAPAPTTAVPSRWVRRRRRAGGASCTSTRAPGPRACGWTGCQRRWARRCLVTDADGALRALDFEDCESRMRRLLRSHYGHLPLSQGTAPTQLTSTLRQYFAGQLQALRAIAWATAAARSSAPCGTPWWTSRPATRAATASSPRRSGCPRVRARWAGRTPRTRLPSWCRVTG